MTSALRVAVLALSLWSSAALAQSDPGLVYGQVPTAAQWNSYFAAKEDNLGYTPLSTAGGIMTGPLITTASTTTAAGFNLTPGSAPAAPNNGDVWTTTAGLFVRINGVTIGPLASTTSTVAQEINLNSAALQTKQTGTILQMGQANTVIARAELDSYAAAAHWTCVRADGTAASPTTLQAADSICSFNGFGYNGMAFAGPAAAVRMFADQNWTNAAQGTYVDIATTPDGSTTLTQVAKFGADGGVQFGSPTGGDKGAGTLNAAGSIYVNNSLVIAGIAALSVGGTNANLTASNGGIVYSGASALAILAGTGTAGQCLISGSNAPPTWGSCSTGAGTVTSVTITAGSQISVSGTCPSAITGSGTCAIAVNSTPPSFCDIILTSATSCNNGGSAANNGTYTTPSGALALEVRLCGGGGGGGGSGSGSSSAGTAGNNTTFGTSFLTGSGGGAGASNATSAGGVGGAASGGDQNVAGGNGMAANSTGVPGGVLANGGMSAFYAGGGINTGPSGSSSNINAIANTGGGGSGGNAAGTIIVGGGGGGAGGCVYKLITSPSATYSYAVGASAAGGGAGTSGQAGGTGAAGRISVVARYN